jgi:DNA-binding MarR family transcriptional regulator
MARRRELDDALALMHFGFRAIIADADRALARRGFGRVHHRVLYFVRRNERITVGDLVRVLGVTKQALHRPLSELVAAKLIARAADAENRRFVHLSLTRAGAAFEEKLSGMQRRHFAAAFASVGAANERGWRDAMRAIAKQGNALGV